MSHPLTAADSAGLRIPYSLATPTQKALALTTLQQQLAIHFPTLPASIWEQALAAIQPDLWLTGPQPALAEVDLYRLVRYLAASVELLQLVPPTLNLAEHLLHTRKLAAWVLPELLAAASPCGPRLYMLICHLAQPDWLAEQPDKSSAWNQLSTSLQPTGQPSGVPRPVSSWVAQWLAQLETIVAASAATPSFGQPPAVSAGPAASPSLLPKSAGPKAASAKARATGQPPWFAPVHQTALFPGTAPQNTPELLDRRSQSDYTENFKRAVVWDVGCGERTKSQARLHYGIQGSSTVLEWCRKYGAQFQAAQLSRTADSAAVTTAKQAAQTPVKQQLQQLKQQLQARHYLSAEEVRDQQDLNLLVRTMQ